MSFLPRRLLKLSRLGLELQVIAAGQLVYSAKKQRDLGEETAPADRLHELMHGWI